VGDFRWYETRRASTRRRNHREDERKHLIITPSRPMASGMSKLPQHLCAAPMLAALIGVTVGACVYDPDQRCGPAMMYVDAANACVCNGNAIAVRGGCQLCAADEVAAGATCACPVGQTKNANNLCVIVAGLGDPCDTASSPCTDTTYSYCAVRGSGTAGTCTKRCTSNTECDAVYTCATWDAHPHCRTFEGAGTSCASSATCTGDAMFCDTFETHTCVVVGCSLTANDCPRETMCCDVSGLGGTTVCAAACP
jgi:hypothetical protein